MYKIQLQVQLQTHDQTDASFMETRLRQRAPHRTAANHAKRQQASISPTP